MPNVKVYSTEFCPYCVVLKEFLKEHKVAFKEIDVTEDQKAQEEMIEKSGQMSVPVVEIDGEIVVGFDREKITTILGLNS